MKVMLVCTAGMSTSLVMKKIERYAQSNTLDIQFVAYPLQEYQEHETEFDMILLGPQISYKLADVQKTSAIPVAVIDTLDYALGNAEKIVDLIYKLRKGE